MAVDWIETGLNLSLGTQAWIKVTDELVTKQIEVDPRLCTTPLRAADHVAIELARFVYVTDLNCNMKRC